MLSSGDIRKAIESGDLVVEPLFKGSIRPAGLRLHLGETLLKPLPGKVVDVKNNVAPDYQEIKITLDKPYRLEPSEFILAATYEKVTVGAEIGFFIEGRSTLARVGLTVVQTAMMVYPGHTQRAVTLELANHGPNPILLYPKMKIARVALVRLSSATEELYDVNGKYREQEDVGAPMFVDEIVEEIE